jgi:hypothetical protein
MITCGGDYRIDKSRLFLRPVQADRPRLPFLGRFFIATRPKAVEGRTRGWWVEKLCLVTLALGQHLRVSDVSGIALQVVQDVLDGTS